MAHESPIPSHAAALPGCSASFLPFSALPVFRALRGLRSAGVPRALTGDRGRQSAGGRVPAPGLHRRIGRARGPGWEAGLARGRGGGGPAPSQRAPSEPPGGGCAAPLRPAAEGAGRKRRWAADAAGEGSAVWAAREEGDAGARLSGGGAAAGRASPPPPSRGRRPGPRPLPALGLPAGHWLGGGAGGCRSVFSSASNRPFPSPLPAPHPIRKRKEQKVPDPRL